MPPSAQQSLEDAVRRHFAVPDQARGHDDPRGARTPDLPRRRVALPPGRRGRRAVPRWPAGCLQTWIEASEPGDGGQRLIAEIGPGEIVGEIGMLAGGQRSAGIRAVRDSLLLRMDAAAFDKLGRERPELIRHIAGGIAARLRDRTAGPVAGHPRRPDCRGAAARWRVRAGRPAAAPFGGPVPRRTGPAPDLRAHARAGRAGPAGRCGQGHFPRTRRLACRPGRPAPLHRLCGRRRRDGLVGSRRASCGPHPAGRECRR